MKVEEKTFEEKAAITLSHVLEDLRDLKNLSGDYEDWNEDERYLEWQTHSVLDSKGVWEGYSKSDAELSFIVVTLATGGPAYGIKIIPTMGYQFDISFWYQDWWKPKHYIDLTAEEQELFEPLASSELELIDI